jgi:sulfur carrier protein
MRVKINGQPMTVETGTNVEQLLTQVSLSPGPCAVERNGDLVPWKQRETVVLHDGDCIEIVTLVGGG